MMLLFILSLFLPANPPPLCQVLDWIQPGEIAVWDADAYTWAGLPGDLRPSGWIFLTDPTLPADRVQALDVYTSASTGETWLFPFYSLAVSTGEHGEHPGNHALCTVWHYPTKANP